MQNISDVIEEHIKKILKQQEEIEIKRSELAEKFQCVPSQINYVLKTRFSIERGYIVESKRGGGGYIRIIKVTQTNDRELFDHMNALINQRLTQNQAHAMILRLLEEGAISNREARLMISAVDRSVIDLNIPVRDEIRANILKAMLHSLKFKM
jgi:transcriptional regulator of stress and heat shock response